MESLDILLDDPRVRDVWTSDEEKQDPRKGMVKTGRTRYVVRLAPGYYDSYNGS